MIRKILATFFLAKGVFAGWWPPPWIDQGPTRTVTIISTITSTPTCACPLESIVTKTVSAVSPVCFCPKETILTTTATARCHCPLKSIVTATAPGICHCPLESIVTRKSTERCYCPVETIVSTTVTEYGSCNTTSRAAATGSTRTGTSPSPTCSLSQLPRSFFLIASNDSYLSLRPTSRRLVNVPAISNATAFQIHTTNDGSITGIKQLAATSRSPNSSAVEYGAWIQTSGVSEGSPVQFFDVNKPPEHGSGYGIVTASFSTYLCSMALITWMDHDLSYPLDCGGELWLGGGFESGSCSPVNVTVSTGMN